MTLCHMNVEIEQPICDEIKLGCLALNEFYDDMMLNVKCLSPPSDNGELTVLAAGRHEYPFSFQLPEE